MECHIFFSEFNDAAINAGGWGSPEGQICLRVTHPLRPAKAIDAVNDAIAQHKYHYLGALELPTPEAAFGTLQNAFTDHPLKNRSMMVGDVVICDPNPGKIVEPSGWSTLTRGQSAQLLHLAHL